MISDRYLTTAFRVLAYCLLVTSGAVLLFFICPPAVPLVLFAIGVRRVHKYRRQLTALGTAQWADDIMFRKHGMLGATSGLILGRVPETRRFLPKSPALVRLPQAVHTAVFAPTGVGKGVSLVIPTLLTCERSCVVIDYKGENARITAEHRRKQFGHRVVLLDPYRKVTQSPDTFNPLDFIRPENSLALDDCNDLANALVLRTGDEKEPHWNDSAEAYISAVASTVVAYGEESSRSLLTIREILSHPQKLDLAVKLMTESDRWGGALAPMGGQLMHYTDKEKSSVLTSALRHLRFLGTPTIAESVQRSSFDPAELRAGRMTVFLILPPDRAAALSGLLRLWVGSLLRSCVRGGLQ